MRSSSSSRSTGFTAFAAYTFFAFIAMMQATPALAQNQYMRGVVLEDNRYNALPVRYGSAVSLPPSKSLKAYYPRVIIQPKTDYTDIGWSAAWYARTAAEAIACAQTDPKKILEISFAPGYNYGLVRKSDDCNSPVSMIDMLESLVRNGTPYFSEFSDLCPLEVPADLYAIAGKKKLSGYSKLYNTADAMNIKVQSVKNALVSNNAVVAGMICPPSFHLAQDFWQPREQQADPLYGGHAVCVVGYDDTKFGGAFEIVNTWGKSWGTQGYTWVRYKDFADFMPYAFGLFQVGGGSCTASFEGNVLFRLISGEEMKVQPDGIGGQFKFQKTYPTGSTFTMQMSTNVPAYVYSFAVDPEQTYFPMFPRAASTLPISFTTLRAPDDMAAVTLTDPPGRNIIYFIFSPVEIDLAKAIAQLKNQKNLTPAMVQATLSGSTPEVTWSNRSLAFTGPLKSPVVISVFLDQVKK